MPKRVLYHFGAIVQAPTPHHLDVIEDAFLLQDEDGRVLATGPWSDRAEDVEVDSVLHLTGAVATPAFVDAHVHLPQLDVRGHGGEDLLPWLEDVVFPEEGRFADAAHARDVSRRFFRILPRLGTLTAAVYLPVQEEAARVAFARGVREPLRLVMGKTMMDRNAPREILDASAMDSLRASEGLADEFHGANGGRVRYAFTPRFAPTCSPELLSGAAKAAERRGAHVQTHLSESVPEMEWVSELNPGVPDYLSVYENAGLVGPRSIFGHAVHLRERAWDRLSARRAWVAHCPCSNEALNVGRMPLEDVPDDARIAIGSDVGGGPSLSVLDTMACARRVHPGEAASPARLLHMATVAGARALRFEKHVGLLAPGMDTSFLLWGKPEGPFDGARFLEDLLAKATAAGRERIVPDVVVANGMTLAASAGEIRA